MKTDILHIENFDFIDELEAHFPEMHLRLYSLKHDIWSILKELQISIPNYEQLDSYHFFREIADVVVLLESREELAKEIAESRKRREAYDGDNKRLAKLMAEPDE